MTIDIVLVHIIIALGIMALAARVADIAGSESGAASKAVVRPMQNATPPRVTSVLWLLAVVIAVGMASGCARSPGVSSGAAGTDGTVRSHRLAESATLPDESEDEADYDPWHSFNENMFSFNHDVLDGYLVKPAAEGWAKICPDTARRSFARLINNLDMPRRLVNNLLEGRPLGAGRELARFAVNSTVGVAGLIDVASLMHIEPSEADFGETLAMYGVGTGPYLVLPTMPPLTVRDAIGRGVDGALDPVSYFLPFIANEAKSIVTAVNERSLNLKLFADVEDSVLDLYSAARNGYLQRRARAISLATQDQHEEWAWAHSLPAAESAPQTAASASRENPT
jgi:phospholipid-binding lipoprotein MlaA